MKRLLPKPKTKVEAAFLLFAKMTIAAMIIVGILVCSVFVYIYIIK